MDVPNPIDQAARYAARQLDGEGFLRWVLPEVFDFWRWTGWTDTQSVPFPGEPDRRCDTVAEFRSRDGSVAPVAVVVEFQTRPQAGMLERLVDYCGAIRRVLPAQVDPRVPYDVVGVVLNLTGGPQPQTLSMRPPHFAGLGSTHDCRVTAVTTLDAEALLADIAAGRTHRSILPWVGLMHGADRAEVIEVWKRLAVAESDPRRKSDYAGLVLIFADLAGWGDTWKTALEGWNVETSRIVNEWIALGEQRGEERGEKRGLNMGLTVVRTNLMRALKARFHVEPSPEVVNAINAQQDPATLDAWFSAAFTAESLEQVSGVILDAR